MAPQSEKPGGTQSRHRLPSVARMPCVAVGLRRHERPTPPSTPVLLQQARGWLSTQGGNRTPGDLFVREAGDANAPPAHHCNRQPHRGRRYWRVRHRSPFGAALSPRRESNSRARASEARSQLRWRGISPRRSQPADRVGAGSCRAPRFPPIASDGIEPSQPGFVVPALEIHQRGSVGGHG